MKNIAKNKQDKILAILHDPDAVRTIIQSGIDKALLMHKLAGNPVCEWRNDQVVWLSPEDISIPDRSPSAITSSEA